MNGLKKYDLIFYKGNSLLSKLIRWITKSEYSHVAVYLGHKHIIETDFKINLSIKHIHYKTGEYNVYRVKELTEKHYIKLDKYIQFHIAEQYDYREIVRILFPFLMLKDNKNKLICSEFVLDLFSYTGINLLDEDAASPADLSKSNKLYKVTI